MENNLINVDLILETDDKTIKMTVNKVIGEGKTSTVYLVTIESKVYALKIQSTPIKDISISNISNNYDCIPHVYYAGKIKDSYATIIEYYPNAKPLNKIMYKSSKMLSIGTISRIGLVVLNNLKHLHSYGLEYPDLSPANIACIQNTKSMQFKFYDFDALRLPSPIYNEKVGKQHESFYSCFECKHSYVDDICSLLFIMITLLGGTFWNYKHIQNLAKYSNNSFFTRFNQLYNSKEPYNSSKYDASPFKTEYRRLISCIKHNVYDMFVSDIQDFLKIKAEHNIIEEIIRNNFSIIHNYICNKYGILSNPKYCYIIGLYLLAIYLTEYSYIKPPGITSIHLYEFIDTKIRYLNIAKIQSLDNIMLFYDYKVNLAPIEINRIYK